MSPNQVFTLKVHSSCASWGSNYTLMRRSATLPAALSPANREIISSGGPQGPPLRNCRYLRPPIPPICHLRNCRHCSPQPFHERNCRYLPPSDPPICETVAICRPQPLLFAKLSPFAAINPSHLRSCRHLQPPTPPICETVAICRPQPLPFAKLSPL